MILPKERKRSEERKRTYCGDGVNAQDESGRLSKQLLPSFRFRLRKSGLAREPCFPVLHIGQNSGVPTSGYTKS